MFASTSSYAASATEYAGTCVYAPAGDADWVNPGNAQGAPDDLPATVILTKPSPNLSDYLSCSDFGFAIPAGSSINNITVILRRSATIAGVMYTGNLRSFKPDSTVWGGGYWDATWGYDQFGPSMFNTPWTAAEINDSGFGFKLLTHYVEGGDNTLTASLDSMQVTVEYTPEEVFEDGFEESN